MTEFERELWLAELDAERYTHNRETRDELLRRVRLEGVAVKAARYEKERRT